MCPLLSKLAREIESSRNEMIQLATQSSLTDHTVIDASTKLDSLLNTYNILMNKKN
ncbi:aspartyl-phosphate phosphatase Spo0E family protein [Neobacillus notoginsengisoli]|uniref:Aspartyl-phosphate phosphatase Spo0E family protein n=2 Tax=Neobacillus notoginsengisoli TaxID=1578198 RepID=A0A417YMM2_9BACI|nr:aspartyl-phosphate phosphatase Spo0E family protein [Neobacillus notoginsengisoli]